MLSAFRWWDVQAFVHLHLGAAFENHMQQQLWSETAEYVHNDVDVDDVDDDEEGAAAYFVLVRDSDGHIK